MQMEAEYSDLFDRKLMSLYGIKGSKPSKMDQAGTESRHITDKRAQGLKSMANGT
jgi:hypothetical protein